VKPTIPVGNSFANAKQDGLAQVKAEALWWRGFHDPLLDRLIQRVLAGNFDLQVATANLREARASLALADSALLPTVTATGAYTDRRQSTDSLGGGSSFIKRQTQLFRVGFDATWELDFFGRIRRSVEAAYADMEVVEATRRDVVVSLTAELARNYIELRGTQNRLLVNRKNAENQKASLDLTVARLDAGRGTKLDTSRASEQLNTTLATIPPLEAQIRHAIYRIAVLTGQPPKTWEKELDSPQPIPQSPAITSIGKPEDLLRRRPDIRIAEQGLAAATANVGVAVADLFPKVSFNGTLALESKDFTGLGAIGSDSHSFGPSIRWAAFDIPRVIQRIRAADAKTEAQLAHYHATVLKALEETEDALVSYGKLQTRLDFLRKAAADSESAAGLARLRFENGVSDFLAVLDAERRLLEAQDRLAATETETAVALIAVYKALGGGWEAAPLPIEPSKPWLLP
jgi:multidrug efflux system outer membrane protein